jgi:heptosyltransferase-3
MGHAIDLLGRVLFFRFASRQVNLNKIHKIAVIKLDHLGDVFLLLPFFEQIKKKYPHCQITLFAQKNVEPLLRHAEQRPDFFIPVEWKDSRNQKKSSVFSKALFLSQIIKNTDRYDMVIDARGDLVVSLASFFSRTKHRVGIRGEEMGTFFYHSFFEWKGVGHETLKSIGLLKTLDVTVTLPWIPKTSYSSADIQKIKTLIQNLPANQPFVLVHPFAGFAYKTLNPTHWAHLLIGIARSVPINVLVVGTEEESYQAKILIDHIKTSIPNSLSLAGKLTINQLMALLTKTHLTLAHDSLPGHVSAATGNETIVLMNAAVDEKRWRPIGNRVTLFRQKDQSHVCRLAQCHIDCPNMIAINQELVIKTAIGILKKKSTDA